jgi:hypothetical protein
MLEEKLDQPGSNQSAEITKEEIAKLLQANLERSEEILKISQEIKKYIRWQNIWGILRLFLIVIPLIIGFIYLPPLIKDVFQSYKSLLMP